MSIFLLILSLLLFSLLVVIHEWGHYLAARRHGIVVVEFGIGFPPRLLGKKLKSGLLVSLNLIPLGGFVKLKGEYDADTSKGSYGAVSLGGKAQVMLAGVGMNLLAAFILFTVLAWVGMPTLVHGQFAVARDTKIIKEVDSKGEVKVGDVSKGSPAETIGIKPGDILLSIGGQPITNPDTVKDVAKTFADQSTAVNFRHNGEIISRTAKLRAPKEGSSYLGVAISSNESGFQIRRFTWSAPIVAVGFMKQVTVLTFKGLWTALRGLGSTIAGLMTGNKQARQAGQANASQVSGPIGIYKLLRNGSALGIQFVLIIIAIISLTLAILNALPIPALDGGRLFLTLLYRTLRRPLKKRTEDLVHGTGFAVLLVLIVLITIVDIKRH